MDNPLNHNGLAAVKGDSRDCIDSLKNCFEERLNADYSVETEQDFSILAESDHIRQRNLLIGFNGYLEKKTRTPEEEIAKSYREHGGDFVKHLNGNFRVILYDGNKDQVHISGDKVGRKVLYYTENTKDFICSSHLTPLLRHPQVDKELDRQAVSDFLQSWSMSFGGGKRLIKNIRRLEPSHRIVYSKGKIEKSKFWEIYRRKRDVSDEEAVKQMDNLLKEAAEELVNKVDDINIFLSGGFDSVFLTQLISEVTQKKINTYTWGWEDSHFEDAEMMSDRLGTNQHSLKLDYGLPSDDDIWFYEEPHNAFARYPFKQLYQEHGMRSYWTGLNSQATFPVCLKNIRKLDRAKRLEPAIRKVNNRKLREFVGKHLGYKTSKGLAIMESDQHSAAAVNDWGVREDESLEMLSEDLKKSTERISKRIDEKWGLEERPYQENYSYLQLRSRDTARYSYYAQDMEHMDIFGYTPLVEYSYSLPVQQKKNRRLLQKIAKGRVPDRIITKGASGWEFVSEQFRRKISRNREEYERNIESFLERGFLNPEKARKVLLPDSYQGLTKGPVNQMMAVYMLERWIQIFVERDTPWRRPEDGSDR